MRRLAGALLAAILLAGLWGCGARPAEDGRLQVVCTLFPYYDFIRVIGGEDVNVTLLVTAGREAHSFEPTPLDMERIARCRLFVCNGGESEAWVEQILDAADSDGRQVVRVMDGLDLLAEELVEGMQAPPEHDHEHEHEHEHEDEHEGEHEDEHEDEHGHAEHGNHEEEIEYDEHVWTSPVMAQSICRQLCDALCDADPDGAAAYTARAEAYIVQLQQLDADFRQVVQSATRDLLVFGDRFPLLYFCRTYGLDYRAAFHGCAADTEPRLTTLKYLIDLVAREEIPVVYTIELSSARIAAAIAETTGARVVTFQSCQSVSREDFNSGATYLSLMQRNVEALREGLC